MSIPSRFSFSGHHRLFAAAVCLGLGSAAMAAPMDSRYQEDRAACLSGSTGQERSACLSEAGAALALQRRGAQQPGPAPEVLMQNALRRCVEMEPERRSVCERMVKGEGQVSGSVSGGGQLRSIETVVPTR